MGVEAWVLEMVEAICFILLAAAGREHTEAAPGAFKRLLPWGRKDE